VATVLVVNEAQRRRAPSTSCCRYSDGAATLARHAARSLHPIDADLARGVADDDE
jgi:hypothetical protein